MNKFLRKQEKFSKKTRTPRFVKIGVFYQKKLLFAQKKYAPNYCNLHVYML